MKPGLSYLGPFMALFILIAASSSAHAYGKSVEDLVGSFSIEKTIKIGSSSECFSSSEPSDPLTPPASISGILTDDQPPGIAGLAIQPEQLFASSPKVVNLTAHLIDDQSVWAAKAVFFGPAGENASALFESQNITSGTSRDGFYEARMSLPGNSAGMWHLHNLTIVDGRGNRKIMQEADLAALGLPTTITVV
ncbi:MAG: hypothetical protein ACP5OU_10525 [Methanothrix sp.]